MAPKEQPGVAEPQKAPRTKSGSKAKVVVNLGDDPPPPPTPDKNQWKFILFLSTYSILSLIVKILALCIIGYVIYTVIVLPKITPHGMGRIIGLVILALVEANLIIVLLFANRGLAKRKLEPISYVTVITILSVLALLQVGGVGLAVFGEAQEQNFLEYMRQDFFKAASNEPKFVKYFRHLEGSMKCCGLDGPEDYRVPNLNVRFPPDVPASCCPSYDPDLSDLEQNKARQICKLNRSYYTQGCKDPATKKFQKVLHPLLIMILISTPLVIVLVGLGLGARFCGKKIQLPPSK